MSGLAWSLFGHLPPGWARVQAIADYVHDRISFGYGYARSTRTAAQAHEERVGVCRDFAHLAITLCRCMNIPARYVNGYLGDIGVPADPAPMDFSAWFEVWLDGKWYTFDARHNMPRIGRVVVARGRDATDVPLLHSFGPHSLTHVQGVDLRAGGRACSHAAAARRPDADGERAGIGRWRRAGQPEEPGNEKGRRFCCEAGGLPCFVRGATLSRDPGITGRASCIWSGRLLPEGQSAEATLWVTKSLDIGSPPFDC